MPLLVRNLILLPHEDERELLSRVLRKFSISAQKVVSWGLVRKGLDARKKGNIRYVCSVRLVLVDEAAFLTDHGHDPDVAPEHESVRPSFPHSRPDAPVVIVGTGPAGLFAALRLCEYGIPATILERGRPVEERVRDVGEFWGKGLLDPESNVQFGEGGAGTFSDGKLTTRVNDPNIAYILEQLVAFGAPPEVRYLAHPHIGTDLLRGIVVSIRNHLRERGCDVRFGSRLSDVRLRGGAVCGAVVDGGEEIACGSLVVAPGHSARDTYEMLLRRGVRLEAKPFAIGLRVEHPQPLIDEIQYGKGHPPVLPPAEYAVAWNDPGTGRSAYSFCMCPGGVVVASASEAGGVVTNGMSLHARNSPSANSALVATVGPADFAGDGPLAGVVFQRVWERKAFEAGGGGYSAPGQNLLSFFSGKSGGRFASSYCPRVREADLTRLLPEPVSKALREGLRHFDRKMRGFLTAEATLTGVETRTSAPVRIVRGADFQSVTVPGLYPAGEGAGYAGGIMSAALDGIRVADAVAARARERDKG
jgi:uncharacterized protein